MNSISTETVGSIFYNKVQEVEPEILRALVYYNYKKNKNDYKSTIKKVPKDNYEKSLETWQDSQCLGSTFDTHLHNAQKLFNEFINIAIENKEVELIKLKKTIDTKIEKLNDLSADIEDKQNDFKAKHEALLKRTQKLKQQEDAIKKRETDIEKKEKDIINRTDYCHVKKGFWPSVFHNAFGTFIFSLFLVLIIVLVTFKTDQPFITLLIDILKKFV